MARILCAPELVHSASHDMPLSMCCCSHRSPPLWFSPRASPSKPTGSSLLTSGSRHELVLYALFLLGHTCLASRLCMLHLWAHLLSLLFPGMQGQPPDPRLPDLPTAAHAPSSSPPCSASFCWEVSTNHFLFHTAQFHMSLFACMLSACRPMMCCVCYNCVPFCTVASPQPDRRGRRSGTAGHNEWKCPGCPVLHVPEWPALGSPIRWAPTCAAEKDTADPCSPALLLM